MTNRGGKGVKTLQVTEKTGRVVAIKAVTDDDDLMIINKSGVTLRMKLENVRVMGRATQGVHLIELEKRRDEISSVCQVPKQTEDENNEIADENLTTDNDANAERSDETNNSQE